MKKIITAASLFLFSFISFSQSEGIGTNNPLARLHVVDSSVFFTAQPVSVPPVNYPLTVNGPGARMMWIPRQAAFRAGNVDGSQWNANNIGTWSFATGYSTLANGRYSIAMGQEAKATGYGASALGGITTASGTYSTAMGVLTTASGGSSTAMGDRSRAIGFASTSMGDSTTASGDRALSAGVKTVASAYGSVAIGRYNDSITTSTTYDWINTDPLFYIGNGTSNTNRHNAMAVYKNGNMVLKNSSTVTTDPGILPLPVSVAGTRMMWLPEKSAFRAGTVEGAQWDASNIGSWSFASGYNTTASWQYSTAMGFFTRANGIAATAMGSRTTASANFSTAMGDTTIASGQASTAMGNRTIASGYASTAMGSRTTASQHYSIAMGDTTIASGHASTAMGAFTIASGNFSTAMGVSTTASGFRSVAIGEFNVAKSYASLTIGRYNDSTASSKIAWVATDPLLILGNGTADNARSNAMVVYKNGDADVTGQLKLIRNNVNDFTDLGFYNKGGVNNMTDRWLVRAYPLGANTGRRMVFYTNGGANLGTIFALFGSGNATLAGTLTQLSDARMKKDLQVITNPLQKIQSLKGYYYHWNDPKQDSSIQIGLLAQQVQKVFPELVHQNENGSLGLNYIGLVPVLITAINEQQQQIEMLKKQNEEILKYIRQKESCLY